MADQQLQAIPANPPEEPPAPPAPADPAAGRAPITEERLGICCASARYWAERLPDHANRQQNKADWWAIAAGILAALTGLAIFPTAENTGDSITVASALVALGAFLSAAFALVPRVKNYGEMAGKAREIASTYGHLQGELMDALAEMRAGGGTDAVRQAVVLEFEAARAKKNELRNLKPREKPADELVG